MRDSLLKRPVKDIDIEVFGVDSLDRLKGPLSRLGTVNEVGKSFGVLKLTTPLGDFDIALPRLETATGLGHRDFAVLHDGAMSFETAAKRRDFTINAMGVDLASGQLLDPFGGATDLKNGILRHVGDAFSEDPLRVYRALQFAGRFELTLAPETIVACRACQTAHLPKERIFEEIKKLLLQSQKPSLGLRLIAPLGLGGFYPELMALVNTQQDPDWHPEGDVWAHTLLVVDQMAMRLTGEPDRDLALMFAALLHDIGKPSTTVFENDRWRSPKHDMVGALIAAHVMIRWTDQKSLIDPVVNLVRHHMKPGMLFNSDAVSGVSDRAIRRLSTQIKIADLVLLATADYYGRGDAPLTPESCPPCDWLTARAAALGVTHAPPTPWLLGRDLIAMGHVPGPKFGEILRIAYQRQIDGKDTDRDGNLAWVVGSFSVKTMFS